METILIVRRSVMCSMLALLLFAVLAPVSAQAGIVSTDEVVTEQTHAVEREQLLEQLDRNDVKAQLKNYGVDAEQAQERVAAMTDAEVLELQAGLDQAIAGGDAGLATLLLVVIIVLLLT